MRSTDLYHRFISSAAIAVVVFMMSVSGVFAQQFLDGLKMTPQTDAMYVSMLFHKMAGFQPDFESWIQNSDEYKKMPSKQKSPYLNERLDVFYNYYNNVSEKKPLVVHLKATLGAYDKERGGYKVEAFNPGLFFNYDYEVGHFAIIPSNIKDFEWFTVPAEVITKDPSIDVDAPASTVYFHLHMMPKSIDKTKPVKIHGQPHWLLAADITQVQMWNVYNQRPLWVTHDKVADPTQ